MSKLKRRSRAFLTGQDKIKLINVSTRCLGNNIIVMPRPNVTRRLIKLSNLCISKSCVYVCAVCWILCRSSPINLITQRRILLEINVQIKEILIFFIGDRVIFVIKYLYYSKKFGFMP